MERISFKTRARTVDHLGREQIADCPTAISELWKNAFDAYALNVSLDIFGGDKPVAVLTDDGHGMSMDEFQNRWLVIGTESKATSETIPKEDRNGLPLRVTQGQKGIGRLSCANLGPILLLISRRSGFPFVASLVDWRLFENPFLNLADIFIPTVEAATISEVFEQLPEMIKGLAQNVKPQEIVGKTSEKDTHEVKEYRRIVKAWNDFDELRERKDGMNSAAILKSILSTNFSIEQLSERHANVNDDMHGTALMVAEINFDLRAQLATAPHDTATARTRKNFRETLASFIDPYIDLDAIEVPSYCKDFSYSVHVWRGGTQSLIVGKEKAITRRQVEQMEHCISGRVDENGIFRGNVKAFGKWLPDKIDIILPTNIHVPKRSDTKLGEFDVFISAMEFDFRKSTHDKVAHDQFKDLADLYSGFMIFRDGLRVLPYGRHDNDFFEIDDRRAKNAGREFWNHRQMFGRIAIKRETNPNLKDKAGREGFLDNRAAKALKDIIDNLLMQSARKFFGSSSTYRKDLLPDIEDAKQQLRDAENRKKLSAANKRAFASRLKNGLESLPVIISELESSIENIDIKTDADVTAAQARIAELKERQPSATFPGAPRTLSPKQKENYSRYRNEAAHARSLFAKISSAVIDQTEKFKPTDPLAILETQLANSRQRISKGINDWLNSVRSMQTAEFARVTDLAKQRKTMFQDDAAAIIQLFQVGRETFVSATKKLTNIENILIEENDAIFEPYVRALESLKESIDLERLATSGMEDLAEARAELDRLNSLAQLGIAVEITGHDLQDFDDIIASGLKQLPDELKNSKAVSDIRIGYEGLTDQLRFLSPLRLSGTKVERWIVGTEIYKYIMEFFGPSFVRNEIKFEATDAYLKMRVFDQPSRLFPVFINLINNSVYWLGTSQTHERHILLDVANQSVILADNGPGVAVEDVENLFKLFFTKKIKGGRGVGLYLSKANLVSGGHTISYATKDEEKLLDGANFIIKFNGAEYSG